MMYYSGDYGRGKRKHRLTTQEAYDKLRKNTAFRTICGFIGTTSFLVLLGTIGAADAGNLQIPQLIVSLLMTTVCMILGGAFRPMEDNK